MISLSHLVTITNVRIKKFSNVLDLYFCIYLTLLSFKWLCLIRFLARNFSTKFLRLADLVVPMTTEVTELGWAGQVAVY